MNKIHVHDLKDEAEFIVDGHGQNMDGFFFEITQSEVRLIIDERAFLLNYDAQHGDWKLRNMDVIGNNFGSLVQVIVEQKESTQLAWSKECQT